MSSWSSGLRGLLTSALLLGSLAGAWQLQRLIEAHQQAQFDYEVRRIDFAVQQRMTAYVQVLRGGLGLFAASDEVVRDEWRRYVETLHLSDRFPGFRSLSFTPAVHEADLPAFIAAVRAEPLPPGLHDPKVLREFALRDPPPPITPTQSELHAPVLYTEPLTAQNAHSIGVDMMRDVGRREVLERAAASGDAVLSPRLKLLRLGGTQAGFIAFLAVHRGDELRGWLTAVFYAEDFMRGLLGTDRPVLSMAIYDGASTDLDALLYSSAGVDAEGGPRPLSQTGAPAFTATSLIPMPGRQWTVQYSAATDFVPFTDRLAPWLVALGGLLASLLFSVTARSGEQLRVALARVAEQATHDPLTGLANRSLFIDRLQTALERGRRRHQGFALAYIDIDGFKAVNDQHGHRAGDELLKAIALRLQEKLRREDTLARLGGDEFALILEQVHPLTSAQRLCAGVVETLFAPFDLEVAGQPLRVQVGASTGVALYPDHGSESDSLIVAADSAMYRAKRGGRNRCVMAGEDAGG